MKWLEAGLHRSHCKMVKYAYICAGCKQLCCGCFGASDDMPDHCDDCWFEAQDDDIDCGKCGEPCENWAKRDISGLCETCYERTDDEEE